MDHKYTVTITGPEGTEIYEGEGFLMILQSRTDTGSSSQIIGHNVNDSLLPGAMVNSRDLLPVAFATAGLAIGKRLAPRPNPLEAILKGALDKAMEEDK